MLYLKHREYLTAGFFGRRRGYRSVKVIFAQRLRHGTGKNVNMTERNGTIHHKIRCYWCNRQGHYSDQCTKTKENKSGNSRNNKNNDSVNEDRKGANTGEKAVQFVFQCEQGKENYLKTTWVLLEHCSTESCTNNPQFLNNIDNCVSTEKLRLHTHGSETS